MQPAATKSVPFFLKVQERKLRQGRKGDTALHIPTPSQAHSQTEQLKECLEMEAEDLETDSLKTPMLRYPLESLHTPLRVLYPIESVLCLK